MNKYTHLSKAESVLISDYPDDGIPAYQISRELNRSKSTIPRKLARNNNKLG